MWDVFVGSFVGGSRPSNHFIASTFSFTAFIVGEFAQGVSGIVYLMLGSKAEGWIVNDEAFSARMTAKTGLLRSWMVSLGVQIKFLQTVIASEV